MSVRLVSDITQVTTIYIGVDLWMAGSLGSYDSGSLAYATCN